MPIDDSESVAVRGCGEYSREPSEPRGSTHRHCLPMTRSSSRRVRMRTAHKRPKREVPDPPLRKLLRMPFVRIGLLVSTPLYVAGMLVVSDSLGHAMPWFVGAFLTGAFAWIPLGWKLVSRFVTTPKPGPEVLALMGAVVYAIGTAVLASLVRLFV